jgi:hypothetical protein
LKLSCERSQEGIHFQKMAANYEFSLDSWVPWIC